MGTGGRDPDQRGGREAVRGAHKPIRKQGYEALQAKHRAGASCTGAQKGEGRAHERWSSSIRKLVQENWKAVMFYQGRIFQDATADINV